MLNAAWPTSNAPLRSAEGQGKRRTAQVRRQQEAGTWALRPSSAVPAARLAAVLQADTALGSSTELDEQPAFEATLHMLEWGRLCSQVCPLLHGRSPTSSTTWPLSGWAAQVPLATASQSELMWQPTCRCRWQPLHRPRWAGRPARTCGRPPQQPQRASGCDRRRQQWMPWRQSLRRT